MGNRNIEVEQANREYLGLQVLKTLHAVSTVIGIESEEEQKYVTVELLQENGIDNDKLLCDVTSGIVYKLGEYRDGSERNVYVDGEMYSIKSKHGLKDKSINNRGYMTFTFYRDKDTSYSLNSTHQNSIEMNMGIHNLMSAINWMLNTDRLSCIIPLSDGQVDNHMDCCKCNNGYTYSWVDGKLVYVCNLESITQVENIHHGKVANMILCLDRFSDLVKEVSNKKNSYKALKFALSAKDIEEYALINEGFNRLLHKRIFSELDVKRSINNVNVKYTGKENIKAFEVEIENFLVWLEGKGKFNRKQLSIL